jgi:hypothetical protein
MRRVIPKRPSQRAVKNTLAMYQAMHDNTAPVIEQTPVKRATPRKQKESAVNDAIIKAARLKGSTLYRNRRGMVRLPLGGMFPYGLGPNGFPDNVGYTTRVITPDMVGRRVAIFTAIEAKVDGPADPHQQECIERIRADGGIAGTAHNGEEAMEIVK